MIIPFFSISNNVSNQHWFESSYFMSLNLASQYLFQILLLIGYIASKYLNFLQSHRPPCTSIETFAFTSSFCALIFLQFWPHLGDCLSITSIVQGSTEFLDHLSRAPLILVWLVMISLLRSLCLQFQFIFGAILPFSILLLRTFYFCRSIHFLFFTLFLPF